MRRGVVMWKLKSSMMMAVLGQKIPWQLYVVVWMIGTGCDRRLPVGADSSTYVGFVRHKYGRGRCETCV